jgi:hypothetical protein
MRGWLRHAGRAGRIIGDRADLWAAGALAWLAYGGVLVFLAAVVPFPSLADLAFFSADIAVSGSALPAVLLGGMVYSEALLLAMIARGAGRQEAYHLVQGAAKRAWGGAGSFRDEVLDDRGIGEWLSADEIGAAMDLDHHLAGIGSTYRALGLDD